MNESGITHAKKIRSSITEDHIIKVMPDNSQSYNFGQLDLELQMKSLTQRNAMSFRASVLNKMQKKNKLIGDKGQAEESTSHRVVERDPVVVHRENMRTSVYDGAEQPSESGCDTPYMSSVENLMFEDKEVDTARADQPRYVVEGKPKTVGI